MQASGAAVDEWWREELTSLFILLSGITNWLACLFKIFINFYLLYHFTTSFNCLSVYSLLNQHYCFFTNSILYKFYKYSVALVGRLPHSKVYIIIGIMLLEINIGAWINTGADPIQYHCRLSLETWCHRIVNLMCPPLVKYRFQHNQIHL